MKPLLAITIAALLSACAWSQTLTGQVVGVHDGDSITVLDAANVQHKVRLNGIDAPELHQAFGTKAKGALSAKVFNQEVTVRGATRDRYGRELGDVYVGSRWINRELVADGFAWHYKAFSKDERLAEAETKAKADKLGLWNDVNPVPPWEYRKTGEKKPPRDGAVQQ